MPTGEGKTLVALLIADSFLEQGRSVCLPDRHRHLADQFAEEARSWVWRRFVSPHETTAAQSSTITTRPR